MVLCLRMAVSVRLASPESLVPEPSALSTFDFGVVFAVAPGTAGQASSGTQLVSYDKALGRVRARGWLTCRGEAGLFLRPVSPMKLSGHFLAFARFSSGSWG